MYMTPPLGYLKPSQKGMVLEILKCLYGLAQSVETEYCEMLFQLETEHSNKELYQIIAQ